MFGRLMKIWNSMQGKLFVFFLMSALFIAGVTWQCQTHLLLVSVEDEEEEYIHNLAKQIAASVIDDREAYENFLIQMSYNRAISNVLSQEFGEDYNQIWDGVDEIRYLITRQMAMAFGINKIQIFHTNQTFCEDGKYLFKMSEAREDGKNITWRRAEPGKYEINCEVANMYNHKDAYLRFLIDTDWVFGRYMEDAGLSGGRYVVVDENGFYVAGSEPQYAELDVDKYGFMEEGKVYRDRKEHMIRVCMPAGALWHILVEYPTDEYSSSKVRGGAIIFAILLLYCLIAGSLLMLFTNRIVIRLKRVGSSLDEIGKRDFHFLDYMRGCDEITRLENSYNDMVTKLSDTVEEMAEMKNKKQQLEIRVLESQINPHFLYNTLGVMQWKAMETDNRELCEMIENMTTFYRLSMSRGMGLIRLEKEIEQIQAYISIQQIRYDHCVECRIEVDEGAKGILMPKMILQSLVENIYLHAGIVLEGNRKIEIAATKEEDLHILICDNGNGMDEDTLYNVNHNINLSDEHGVGISYIHNSLELYYGKQGKLRFRSRLKEGTVAELWIPAMTEG